MTYTERERLRLSWRLRLGLGEPEELEEEEERELEEPERLEPDELDPLEEPELEPELLLEVELDLDLVMFKTKKKKNQEWKERKVQNEISSVMYCVYCVYLWMHVWRTLENKPAAAAAGRSTAAFPYFLAASLLVSILGSSLVFTSVFSFFLLLPLCGWGCPKDKARW